MSTEYVTHRACRDCGGSGQQGEYIYLGIGNRSWVTDGTDCPACKGDGHERVVTEEDAEEAAREFRWGERL